MHSYTLQEEESNSDSDEGAKKKQEKPEQKKKKGDKEDPEVCMYVRMYMHVWTIALSSH